MSASDTGGAANLSSLQMLVDWSPNGSNACYVMYVPSAGLYLAMDQGGWLGPSAPGTGASLTNSQCTLNAVATTVSSVGNTVTMNPVVTFNSSFVGALGVYVYASDATGNNTGWQQVLTYTTFPASSQPPTGSVTPNSGAGLSQVFTVNTQDVNGWKYLGYEQLLIGPNANPANSCLTMLNSEYGGALFLMNDGNTQWLGPIFLNAPATVSNHQCTISSGATTMSTSGNNLTFNLSVSFAASGGFPIGQSENMYLNIVDQAGQASGWIAAGTWIVGPPPDFTMTLTPTSSPATAMVGGSATYTVAVGSISGFNGTVTLTAPGLPNGASATFSPTSITGSGASTMTVTAPISGTGNFTVTANGTSGSLSHNAVSVLQVQDYTVTLSPYYYGSPPVITAGATQTFTISAAGINGFTGYVSLAWPPQSNCNLTALNLPPQVAAGSAVTMTMAPYGQQQCIFQISANVNGDAHVLNGSVIVSSAANFGFTLSLTQGTLTATPTTAPSQVVFTPSLTIVNYFCGTIDFQVLGLPTGVTATASPVNLCANSPQTAQIALTVQPGVLQGTYPLTINAFGSNGNAGQASSQLIYPVGSGGSTFSITASPPQTTTPGGTAQYTVTVNGSSGLGNVTLTASGGLSGATVLLNGSTSATVPVSGSATMTVAVPSNAGLGTYSIPIAGMLGTVPKYALATLIVGAASPAGILAPAPGSILSTTPATFTWSPGSGVSQYQLNLGSAPGAADYYSGSFSSQSAIVPVPVQNQQTTFYATLGSLISGTWQSQSYSYRTGSRPTGVTPGAAAASPSQPGSYAVYNNGGPMVAGPYQVYDAYTRAPLDAGYFDPNSCAVSGSGVVARISAIPSQSVPGDYSTYNVTFTANYSTAPGPRDLTCTWASIALTITHAVTVYDASPFINALQPFPPSPDGSFYVTLYGTNFGPGPGSISVCASGDSSCAGTPNVAVDMSGAFGSWSDEQVNVRLVPAPSASGSYDLQLGSVGETGNGFLAQQGGTSSQSNRARLQIGQGITMALSNKLWFFGQGVTPPAQFSLGSTKAVLSTNAAQGGSFYWSISSGQDKVSFNPSQYQATSYTVTDYVTIYSSSYSVDVNDVTVMLSYTDTSGNTVSVSTSFTVDSPYTLVSRGPTTTGKVVPNGCTSQAPGTWGYISFVPYRMVSFLGITIANEFINEYFVNQTISIPNNWGTYTSLQGHYLSSDGTFSDIICESSPTAMPQPLKSAALIDSGTQLWYIGSPLNGNGVEVQSDLFQRFQDHGGHTNVVSPVR